MTRMSIYCRQTTRRKTDETTAKNMDIEKKLLELKAQG
jgi:hypothetical protein